MLFHSEYWFWVHWEDQSCTQHRPQLRTILKIKRATTNCQLGEGWRRYTEVAASELSCRTLSAFGFRPVLFAFFSIRSKIQQLLILSPKHPLKVARLMSGTILYCNTSNRCRHSSSTPRIKLETLTSKLKYYECAAFAMWADKLAKQQHDISWPLR